MTTNGMPSPNPKNYFISPLPPNYFVHTYIMTLFPICLPHLKKKKGLNVWKENFTSQVTSANKCMHFHFNTIDCHYGHEKKLWYLCYYLRISQCNKNNIVYTLLLEPSIHNLLHLVLSWWFTQCLCWKFLLVCLGEGVNCFSSLAGNVICYICCYALARFWGRSLVLLMVAPQRSPAGRVFSHLSPPQGFQNVFANNTMLSFIVCSWIYWNYLTCQMSLRS